MADQDDVVELRIAVPRSALPNRGVAPPEYFSQHNCESLLGLKPRAFLELLRRADAPASKRVGKSRLVARDAMMAFIDSLDAQSKARAEESLDEGDRYLSEIGAQPSRRVG